MNILTGQVEELLEHFSSHMDVNTIIYCGDNNKRIKTIKMNAALNVKRVILYSDKDLLKESSQDPYYILKTQETKTTWHPIGV